MGSVDGVAVTINSRGIFDRLTPIDALFSVYADDSVTWLLVFYLVYGFQRFPVCTLFVIDKLANRWSEHTSFLRPKAFVDEF